MKNHDRYEAAYRHEFPYFSVKRDNYLFLSHSLSLFLGARFATQFRFERGNRIRGGIHSRGWRGDRKEGLKETGSKGEKKGCSTWYLQTAISRNGIDVANKLRNGWTKGEGNSLRNACELINLFALITSSSSTSIGGSMAIGWGPFHDVIYHDDRGFPGNARLTFTTMWRQSKVTGIDEEGEGEGKASPEERGK